MQPAGPKSVFDVSDVVMIVLVLTLKIFSLLKYARLHFSGDRWCLFPDGRLQPCTAVVFPTTDFPSHLSFHHRHRNIPSSHQSRSDIPIA